MLDEQTFHLTLLSKLAKLNRSHILFVSIPLHRENQSNDKKIFVRTVRTYNVPVNFQAVAFSLSIGARI